MTAKLTIKNNYDTKRNVSLLDWVINGDKPNLGLPRNILVTVRIKKEGSYFRDVSYKDFQLQFVCQPIVIAVKKSTNNRQLSFHCWNMYNNLFPIVPQITINGLPHYKDKKDIWNSHNHNIADSGEKFILDGKQMIKINLNPNQKFEIEFETYKQIIISANPSNQRNLRSIK